MPVEPLEQAEEPWPALGVAHLLGPLGPVTPRVVTIGPVDEQLTGNDQAQDHPRHGDPVCRPLVARQPRQRLADHRCLRSKSAIDDRSADVPVSGNRQPPRRWLSAGRAASRSLSVPWRASYGVTRCRFKGVAHQPRMFDPATSPPGHCVQAAPPPARTGVEGTDTELGSGHAASKNLHSVLAPGRRVPLVGLGRHLALASDSMRCTARRSALKSLLVTYPARPPISRWWIRSSSTSVQSTHSVCLSVPSAAR